jgi:hypothetical protein
LETLAQHRALIGQLQDEVDYMRRHGEAMEARLDSRSPSNKNNDSDTSTSGNWMKHAIIQDRYKRLPARHKQDNTYKLKDNINQPDTTTLTTSNWKPLRRAKPKR